MKKHSGLPLMGAVALWTAIGTFTALADSAQQNVRARQTEANAAARVHIASTGSPSCQTIACPRYRLVGIAY